MDLKEENAIGGKPSDHWYYISKGRAIKDLIGDTPPRAVLDVGAGSGVFSRMLLEDGAMHKAFCIDPHYSAEQLGEYEGGRLQFLRGLKNKVDADVVLMIDVIEHVDDDQGLIREYVAKTPDKARFIISVPAFNALWSPHDEFLEHRRRYTLETLKASVEGAGLVARDLRYFYGALFPAVAAMRMAAKAMQGDRQARQSALKAAPGWLNRSLIALHDLERRTFFAKNKFAGVTAFCVAEKPQAPNQQALASNQQALAPGNKVA